MPAELIVRNTFIEHVAVEDPSLENGNQLRRVKSESDMSNSTAPPSRGNVAHWQDELATMYSSSQDALSGQITPTTPKDFQCSGSESGRSTRLNPSDFSSNDFGDTTLPPPSIGSVRHHEGGCRPCHYVFIKKGCSNGDKCEFCHYSHQHLKKRRPCKEQRDGYKRLIASLDAVQDPVFAITKALAQSETKPYLKNKLVEKLRQLYVREADTLPKNALEVEDMFDVQEQLDCVPADFVPQTEQRYVGAIPQMPKAQFGGKPNANNKLKEKLKQLHQQEQKEQQFPTTHMPQVKKLVSL